MAIQTPTIREIANNIISDIEAELSQTIPLLAKAVFRLLSWAFAGIFIILYKYGTDAYNQRFVQTAGRDFLILLGNLVGVTITAAQAWEGFGTSVAGVGATVYAGTQLVNNATGTIYLVLSDASEAAGIVTLNLRAASTGDITNLNIGDTLRYVNPISDVTDLNTT
jgi:uncharacterized phage protein gp47/JayE